MKPQQQTIRYPKGNCHAACIASILEIPLEEMPNYHGYNWWNRWQEWLYRNYRSTFIYWEDDEKDEWPPFNTLAWWIGEVIPTKIPHSVVFYRDQFRWDPYPGGPRNKFNVTDVKSIVAIYSIASVFQSQSDVLPKSPTSDLQN